jgi:hemerythrin
MEYNDIKKIIESCHLNFLIGSGASKPFLKTLSQVENLLTELSTDTETDEEEKIILEASIKYHYFNCCIKGNVEIVKGTDSPLLETLNNYDVLLNSLFRILSRRRSNLVSKQVNLFTSNMDIFLDWSLEKNQFSFNDGFLGRINPLFGTQNFHNIIRKTSPYYDYQSEVPLFNLFKLHGSANWKQIGNSIRYDYSLSNIRNIIKYPIVKENLIAVDKKVKGVLISKNITELKQELTAGEIEKTEFHDEFLVLFNKLVMINPTKQKFETTTRDLTFYELLRMYSNHLERENSVLFVLGFSFNDEHIREITKRVAVSNPTLQIIVFAHSENSKKEIEANLTERPTIKYIWDNSEEDPIKYTLSEINNHYFKKMADDLEHATDNKIEA